MLRLAWGDALLKMLLLSFLMFLLGGTDPTYAGKKGSKNCRNDNFLIIQFCKKFPYQLSINKVSGKAGIFTGIPKIIDGDSIKIGNTRIRLFGIDAPESNQICHYQGAEWFCGWEATNALANIVGQHWVTCVQKNIDRYGRVIAVCRAGPIDLSAWMVANGWALAYRRYSRDYVDEEETARARKRGVWRGRFIQPWKWRRIRRFKL